MFKKATTLKKRATQLFSTRLAAGALSLATQAATADVLFVGSTVNESDNNRLVLFSSEKPKKTRTIKLKGLQVGERIVCLDMRPANGQLYAVSTASQLYQIAPSQLRGERVTATPIGGPLTPALQGDSFGCW